MSIYIVQLNVLTNMYDHEPLPQLRYEFLSPLKDFLCPFVIHLPDPYQLEKIIALLSNRIQQCVFSKILYKWN